MHESSTLMPPATNSLVVHPAPAGLAGSDACSAAGLRRLKVD